MFVYQLLISLFFLSGFVFQVSAHQSDSEPNYGEPQPVFFEFGLKITSNGNSSGVLGTVPIPVDWPEQKITIIRKSKTENLRKITFKDLKGDIRQMILKANRLKTGEIAQGTVVIRADKRFVIAPSNQSGLKLSNRIPAKLKQFLRPSPYIESDHKRINDLADSIPLDDQDTAWEQLEKIYKWVRENIEYRFDKQIHTCLEALDSGIGDCEEMSSLFIAICRAKGIPARAVWVPGHTYPEFYLVDEKGAGHWFPCQVAGTYEFGAMSELRPILQKGDRFKLPGNSKTLRYVQPTLVAKNSSAGLSIEFISRQITDENEISKYLSSSSEE